MRFALVFLVGCGSVSADKHDAATMQIDASCGTEHNTVTSCGATCAMCPGTAGRQLATCDGTACGLGCVDNAPKCSDSTCSKLVWSFDDGMLDGITPRAPNTLTLSVRSHLASNAIAIDVTNFQAEVSFTIPICVTGSDDLSTKTLSADVFFEGPSAGGDQYYVQGSTPGPTTGNFVGNTGLAANATKTFSGPMSMSAMSNATTTVVFQAGSFGESFTGTIWFDNIKIQ